MIAFDRIVVVENPYSSNAARASRMVTKLYDAFPTFYDPAAVPIMTQPDRTETIEAVQEAAKPGDLFVVKAGDDTVSRVAEALRGLQDVTLLPLWGGNGNDAAHDLNGKHDKRPVHELILHGERVAVHPVDLTIDGLRKQVLNYFEMGSNPKVASLLNAKTWRGLPGYDNDAIRSTYENVFAPPTAFFSRRFPVVENNTKRSIVNFSLIHSRHAAKHAIFPIDLAQNRAYMTESKNPFGLAIWGMQALFGETSGEYLEPDTMRTIAVGRTILYHIDAEPDILEKGTSVTMQMAEDPFYAVSTRHLIEAGR